jgi:LacI family transcriptional regulator
MPERVTIVEVANQAGVSTATVSRVINEVNKVSPETVSRVRQAIKALGYVPNLAARTLVGNSPKILGIIVPAVSSPFLTILIQSVNLAAIENNYNLLIYTTVNQTSLFAANPLPLNEHLTNGLLIFANSVDDATIRHFYRKHFPLVLLYRSPPQGTTIPCIGISNKSGTFKVIEHLITTCKRRRIAFLTGPADNEDSMWREKGYREALEFYGLPFDPALMGQGGYHDWMAKEQIEEWLRIGLDVDAIFAGDDTSAMVVMSVLQAAGKRVPEDIAVVGFNDDPLSKYASPPLTTVRAPTENIGDYAVAELLQLINGEPAAPMTLVDVELVIRESCGAKMA